MTSQQPFIKLKAAFKDFNMKILITGGSGFIGSALVSELSAQNHHIIILTRNIGKTSQIFGGQNNVEYCTILDQIPSSSKIDYIINLAGARVSAFPWTVSRKQRLIDSRVLTTGNIITLIQRLKIKPKKLLSASAVGWYGTECQDIKIDENHKTNDSSFSHILCDKWEKMANIATELGVEVDILRLGNVLGANGGMLKNLHGLFKIGAGFYAGSGKQGMTWIHISDVVHAIIFLLNNKIITSESVIYNFVAPTPVTNKEFNLNLAQALHRPLLFRMPEFFVKLLLGKMGDELLLSDLACLPQNLLKSGYEFKYRELGDALKSIYPT